MAGDRVSKSLDRLMSDVRRCYRTASRSERIDIIRRVQALLTQQLQAMALEIAEIEFGETHSEYHQFDFRINFDQGV